MPSFINLNTLFGYTDVVAPFGTAMLTCIAFVGVVFDSGDGVSHSVPVFDGYCLPHAVQRFPLAGTDVTAHLIKVLGDGSFVL